MFYWLFSSFEWSSVSLAHRLQMQKALTQDFRLQFLLQIGSLISFFKFCFFSPHIAFLCVLAVYICSYKPAVSPAGARSTETVAVSAVPFLWAWHIACWVDGVQSVCLEKLNGGEQSTAQGGDGPVPGHTAVDGQALFSVQAFWPGPEPQPLHVALRSRPAPGEDGGQWGFTFSLSRSSADAVRFSLPHGHSPRSCTWP